MMKVERNYLLVGMLFGMSNIFFSCSPIKSSPQDERHQLELTLHEVQTNLDDSRHDLNCFRTEMQILDSKVQQLENFSSNIKNKYLENFQLQCEQIMEKLSRLDKKLYDEVVKQESVKNDLQNLSIHANESGEALKQCKERLYELEKDGIAQNKKWSEVIKLRKTIDLLAELIKKGDSTVIHKVISGDSLEKIAKQYRISVEELMKENNLSKDLIVIGQELVIPEKK